MLVRMQSTLITHIDVFFFRDLGNNIVLVSRLNILCLTMPCLQLVYFIVLISIVNLTISEFWNTVPVNALAIITGNSIKIPVQPEVLCATLMAQLGSSLYCYRSGRCVAKLGSLDDVIGRPRQDGIAKHQVRMSVDDSHTSSTFGVIVHLTRKYCHSSSQLICVGQNRTLFYQLSGKLVYKLRLLFSINH